MPVRYRAMIDIILPDHPSCMKCLIKEIYEKFGTPPRIKIDHMIMLDDVDIEKIERANKNATT